MNGPHTPDQASSKKKSMSPSGAKASSARLGQPGKATSTPNSERQPKNKATSQRGRPRTKAGQGPQPASAPTKLTDGDPAKSKLSISRWWGTIIGLAVIAYFSYQTITVGFNYISLFLTFAGLSLGAWLAVAWIAVQFVRLNWLLIIYLPAATTVTLGFAAMNRPEPLIFFNAPISAPPGACHASPAGWIFDGFEPGRCAGIAFGRLGLVVAGFIVTIIMAAMNGSIKWRARYLLDNSGRRRFMRNERRAWEYARRGKARSQFDKTRRKISKLEIDLKAAPRRSEEAARIRHELKQLGAESSNKFRTMVHDIHIYRKEHRSERRQRRMQWRFRDWLRRHPYYGIDPDSIVSPTGGIGTRPEARESASKPLSRSRAPKELSKPRIISEPVKRRSAFRSCYAFRYCVEHWTKHYDIYVYIHKNAPERIIKNAGRAALQSVLSRGEAPNRVFIDATGKTVSNPVSSFLDSDWDPR